MMKAVYIVLLLTLLAALTSCAKPEFSQANLAVDPGQVVPGESAIVSVDVSNTGNARGTCPVSLKIDGVEKGNQEIQLEPGETRKVSFTVAGEKPGTLAIDVNGVAGNLKVLKPADIRTSSLAVVPAEVAPGSAATVTVTASNSGEVDGDVTFALTCDGKSVESKAVTLKGGASTSVDFSISRSETGNYLLSVGGLTATLKVTGDTFPVLRNGDRWVYNHTLEGVAYKRVETVMGEGVILGNDCYQFKVEWAPLFVGRVSQMEYMIEKKSRENLWTSFSFAANGQNTAMAFVSEITRTGPSPWRLFVGNEWSENERQLQKSEISGQPATTSVKLMETLFRVEAIETITVPAGTFRCFKFAFCTGDGVKFEENWYSVEAKNWVKLRNLETGETYELFAHSVKS